MGGQRKHDGGVQQPPTDIGMEPGEAGHCEPPSFVKEHPPESEPMGAERDEKTPAQPPCA
jgi:hypothetical protein